MSNTKEYRKGYQAGRKYRDAETDQLHQEVRELRRVDQQKREERVYFNCLALALEHCQGWKIDKKRINNAEGFCTLAKIFADNSISKIG